MLLTAYRVPPTAYCPLAHADGFCHAVDDLLAVDRHFGRSAEAEFHAIVEISSTVRVMFSPMTICSPFLRLSTSIVDASLCGVERWTATRKLSGQTRRVQTSLELTQLNL